MSLLKSNPMLTRTECLGLVDILQGEADPGKPIHVSEAGQSYCEVVAVATKKGGPRDGICIILGSRTTWGAAEA